MQIWKKFIAAFVLGTTLATLSLNVHAGERSTTSSPTLLAQETVYREQESIADLFNRAFYHNTGRFFELTDLSGQANALFGWRTFPGSFVDNMIANDGKIITTLYSDVLRQQTSGPLIRTQDLPNPFNTSLQENPDYLSPSRP